MLEKLLLTILLCVQDPKPAPKTVEDRLKELDEKVATLEKRHKTLSDENAAMEKQIADMKALREQLARQTATSWVQQHAKAVQFTEQQREGLEKLWFGWAMEDLGKRADAAAWKAREELIRKELSPAQIPLLAAKVRQDQEANAQRILSFLTRAAKLDAEKRTAFEKAVLGKIDFEEGALLPQAHPEKVEPWTKIPDAVEAVLPQFSPRLTEGEAKAIRQLTEQWKPRQR
jgi:hypothetical protein